VLRLVLPKGSLERATIELFEAADLAVSRRSDVDYKASVEDHRISEVRILRPQEIPRYVADGLFDIGITGRDWVEETGVGVVSLGELSYSKATSQPIRIVLAVAEDSAWEAAKDMPDGVKISTEYPLLTERFFSANGVKADVVLSYGATEAKVPEIADAVVELTETGRALKAAGLKVIETVLVSYTELIANPEAYERPEQRKAMEDINTLLQGALKARGRVLVKLNVQAVDLDAVVSLLPAMRSPTVSELFGGGSYAVETVVPKEAINKLIPELKDAGASDIIELPISKIVA
jgi:ATP phosphoribosyltransferase